MKPWEFLLENGQVVPVRVTSGPHAQAPKTWPTVWAAEALGVKAENQLYPRAAIAKLVHEIYVQRNELVREIRGGL